MTGLPVIRSYEDLHRALRARAEQLDISRETIDRLAAFTPGYASKVLAPTPIKKLGLESVFFLLDALGLELQPKINRQAMERITRFGKKRQMKVAMQAVKNRRGLHGIVSKKFLRKIAPLGGQAFIAKVPPRKRRAMARKAAKARWHTPRLVEASPQEAQAIRRAIADAPSPTPAPTPAPNKPSASSPRRSRPGGPKSGRAGD